MLTVAEARQGIDEFTDIRRDMVVLENISTPSAFWTRDLS